MATRPIPPPPALAKLFEEDGTVSRSWLEFFGAVQRASNRTVVIVDSNGDTVFSVDSNGNVIFANNIEAVDGAFSGHISGVTLKITDHGIIGSLAVEDDVSVDGNLSVAGDISGSDIAASGELSGETLDIENNAAVGGNLAVTGDISGSDITGDLLDVTGEVGGGSLDIAGAGDIDGALAVGGDLTAEADADVVGDLTAGTVESDAEVVANGELQADNGILRLAETVTPSADENFGKVYTKDTNGLFFQDGAGFEHLLHGDAFSDLWYHGAATPVGIGAQNAMTLINIMENVRGEDDLGNAVGSTADNEIEIGVNGAGTYNISHNEAITVAGGVKKEMLIAVGVELATPFVITNVTDDTVSPIVVTIGAGHGILNGDMVEISGVLVNDAANGSFIASAVDATTLTLVDLDNGTTTGDGDYDEGTPTGSITHCYPGTLVAHRIVNQSDVGSMSASGKFNLSAGDKVAMYVANLDDSNNLSVLIMNLDITRVGD